MEPLIVKAKTLEEAVQRALDRLGLDRTAVVIEVITRGKSGFLGIGAEEAVISVTPKEEEKPDPAQVGREVLEKLLSLMGIQAQVESTVSSTNEEAFQSPSLLLDVKGEDLGILIGRRGQTMSSLQHIVRLIVAHCLHERVPLTVDVEGYKQRQMHSLRDMALRMAQRVSDSGRTITLEPMPPGERRVIHLALAGHPQVTTQSVGDDEERKVVIQPRPR